MLQRAKEDWALKTVGRITDPLLNELSGIAYSERNCVLWAHNDSGDLPRVYAVDFSGRTVGHLWLHNAHAIDWEDMAIGPCGTAGGTCLFVGDIGDNWRFRPTITVYQVVEPLLPSESADPAQLVAWAERLELRFPDGHHDCEALMRDPLSDFVYLATKELDATTHVFRASIGQSNAVLDKVVTLSVRWVAAEEQFEGITAGAISSDGRRIALRTYAAIAEWIRTPPESVGDALARRPVRVLRLLHPGGESLSYLSNGSLVMTHECLPAPIQTVAAFSQIRAGAGAGGHEFCR